MGRFLLLLFLIILIGIGYLTTLNKETITIVLAPGEVYEAPKIVVMLASGITGACLVLLIFIVRDTRRFIKNLAQQKREKREERKKELYATALDQLLAGRLDAARDTLELIIKDFPDFIDAYLKLVENALELKDLQKAYSYAEKARQLAPRRLDVLFTMENLMEKTGRIKDALRYVDEILNLDRTNLAALYKKRALLETVASLSQSDKGVEVPSKNLLIFGDTTEVWEELIEIERQIIKNLSDEVSRQKEKRFLAGYKYELGQVYLEKKELEKAKKLFKTAIRIERFFIPAYLGLTEALVLEGAMEEAIEFLWNSYEDTSSPLLLARLEDLLIANGEPARLIRYYKSAIAKRPNDTLLNFLLGKLYYRLEMIDESIDILKGLEAYGTTFPELHRLLGNLYLKRRQPERAALEFRKAIDIRKTLRLNYCCNNCGYTSELWSGRCPNCKEWNSYTFNLEWFCKETAFSKERETKIEGVPH